MHNPIIIMPLKYCNDNGKGLDQWLRWSPSTRFRYISYKNCNKICLDYPTLEKYYPECETILSIVNPYTLTFRIFKKTYFLHKMRNINDFVQSNNFKYLIKNPLTILKNKINSKPYYILRNEYFYLDLRNLEKTLESPFIEVEIAEEKYQHKKIFNQISIDIVKEFFLDYINVYYYDFD